MQSITFDEGYKEYALNGDESRVIKIRLSDPNLLQRVEAAQDKIQELTEKFKGEPDSEQLAEFDKSVKELLNAAFDTDISTPLFGDSSVLTFIPGTNKLVLAGFMEAFLPLLGKEIEAIKKSLDVRPEVKKYLEPEFDVNSLTEEQKQALLAKLQ